LSDPSGNYSSFLQKRKISLGSNIEVLTGIHSFCRVLEKSDLFLRITTTDGDSLSVKEALSLDVRVLASNVVKRPNGVCLFSDSFLSLESEIIQCIKKTEKYHFQDSALEDLLTLYNS
jgi:hypothetical protein